MATKEYEVTLRLRVDDNPAHWGWYTLLDMSPDESVEVRSCTLVRLDITHEMEEWLPETDEEDS